MIIDIQKKFTLLFVFGHFISFCQLKAYSDTCSIGLSGAKETFTIPEISAEYPGGFKKFAEFINEKISSKIVITKSEAAIFQTPVAQWIIDEHGKATDVKIMKSSGIVKVDDQFIQGLKNMPPWKPAENYKKKVRQEFRLPLKICFK